MHRHMHIHRSIATILGACALALAPSCSSTRQDVASASGPMSKQDAHAQGEMQLPPGWSMEDMQACMIAGTPGEMHQKLARHNGTWSGTNTMWMAPGSEPMTSKVSAKATTVMDGRYVQWNFDGEIPGMGPYHGLGYAGYDNAAGKFISTWLDNHSTGIMRGTGVLSNDGNTLTWTYEYFCPIRKSMATMREVQTYKGDDSITLEMFGADPKSGKDYQMMKIELKRGSS